MEGKTSFFEFLESKLQEEPTAEGLQYDKDNEGLLLSSVSNTDDEAPDVESLDIVFFRSIKDYIKDPDRCPTSVLNYYSEQFGDTPLTLALLKGYKHKAPYTVYSKGEERIEYSNMKDIIDSILKREDLEINKECKLGLSAIEIAILRHDEPEFIKKLIMKRAEIPNQDRIDQLLSLKYEQVALILSRMCCGNFKKHDIESSIYDCGTKTGKDIEKIKDAAVATLSSVDFKNNKSLIEDLFRIDKEGTLINLTHNKEIDCKIY